VGKTLIIPFFIPHGGCPFTCVFCNQWEISGQSEELKPEAFSRRVQSFLATAQVTEDTRIEAAFFGGSFTGLPVEVQLKWLKEGLNAIQKGEIAGLRLSTRPDYIDDGILRMLCAHGVTTIELGVQSLVNEVLLETRRGHTYEDILRATEIIRKYPVQLGYQLMLGLPGDKEEYIFLTARRAVEARPDFIRIYPTVVLKDTLLAQWYEQGVYHPLSLSEAVTYAAHWLATFSLYDIPVIRIGLQAAENLSLAGDLLAGPYHPAFGELVESYLMREQILYFLQKINFREQELILYINPRDYSKVVGQKRCNIGFFKQHLNIEEIKVVPDPAIPNEDIGILLSSSSHPLILARQEFLEKYRIK
jgi:histone acetyltransferase (RNA polymerase elongator complex component)